MSPADEALYGLGQHQEESSTCESFRFVCSKPIRIFLFCLCRPKAMAALNNASLTDFNTADEPITLNAATGEGHSEQVRRESMDFADREPKEQAAPFCRRQGDHRYQQYVGCNSASAKIRLEAETDYKIRLKLAQYQSVVRPPSRLLISF